MPGVLKSSSGKGTVDISKKKFAIVVSEWNEEVTSALFEGAYQSLLSMGAKKSNIIRVNVPGSFELPLGAQRMAEKKEIAAVICLGCVIQGETPHFDFICQAAAQGIMNVSLKSNKPVAFGVLTTFDKKQAIERAGGKYGNKGEDSAYAVLKLLAK